MIPIASLSETPAAPAVLPGALLVAAPACVVVAAAVLARRTLVPTRVPTPKPVSDTGRADTPTARRRRPRWAPPTIRRLRRAGIVGAMVCVAALLVGPFGGAAALGVVVLLRRVRPLLTARRTRAAVDRDLPDAIDLLVLGIHAGLTPRQGVELLARSAPESFRPTCAAVAHHAERGHAFADALAVIRDELGERAGVIADVVGAADRYGFPLAPVLDQLTVEARSARRRLDEADARRLPVRLSFPLVVCTLPSFVLLAIAPAVIAALSSLGTTAW